MQNARFVANFFIPVSETGNGATVFNFIRFHFITIGQVVSLVLFGILVFARWESICGMQRVSHIINTSECAINLFFSVEIT